MTLDVDADARLRERAWRIRRRIVRMCGGPQGGHLGGSLSLVEILATLFFDVLSPPPWEQGAGTPGDRVVLSKGHGALALYATLAEAGMLAEDAIEQYGRSGTSLGGHPSAGTRGVELSTGSLGHGLSFAVGMAQAAVFRGLAGRVFVVVGDGELQEGSVWEGMMAAARLGLDRCTLVVDRNGLQLTGATEQRLSLEPLGERITAFGWDVAECDGHDPEALRAALGAEAATTPRRPRAVIARTVKGKGLPFLEGKASSHYATLSERQLQRCLRALGPAAPGAGPPEGSR
jgi:transketolase